MKRELRVVDDLVTAAVAAFLEAEPRTIALAGGSTPRALYEKLATVEYAWRDVDVFFGDERCVPPDHPDSNFRMAEESLLSSLGSQGPKVHPMPGESCDAEGYERELRDRFAQGVPELDLVLLGLGEDGHTASLFPGDPALDEADRLVARVERPDHPRLTLTLPVLSAARLVLFLVAGEPKRDALRRLTAGADIPAARVRAIRTVILADPAAANRASDA